MSIIPRSVCGKKKKKKRRRRRHTLKIHKNKTDQLAHVSKSPYGMYNLGTEHVVKKKKKEKRGM